MTDFLTYTNRKGDTYYFCRKAGKGGGEQIVASTKKSKDSLTDLPRGMEIAETPNGKVFCRKKLKSLIQKAELNAIKKWIPKLRKQAMVAVELKEKEIVVHSSEIPKLPGFNTDKFVDAAVRKLPPEERKLAEKMMAQRQNELLNQIVQYTPAVKFELQDAENRTFALFRMCHISAMVEWMYLDSGTLDELAQRIMPTLETDEFFEIL